MVGMSKSYEQSAHTKSLILKKNAVSLAFGVINIFERNISQAEYRVHWYQAKWEVCTR